MYKVGDEVMIKPKSWFNDNNTNGEVSCGKLFFTTNMSKYCNKKAIIKNINPISGAYTLDIDNEFYHWNDNMFIDTNVADNIIDKNIYDLAKEIFIKQINDSMTTNDINSIAIIAIKQAKIFVDVFNNKTNDIQI